LESFIILFNNFAAGDTNGINMKQKIVRNKKYTNVKPIIIHKCCVSLS
jgi:hypothetical protein